MSEKLFEADFLRVDLRSILSSQSAAAETEVTTNEVSSSAETNDSPSGIIKDTAASAAITDWGQELKNRLKANRELSREARLPEFEIESKFFKEYFKANWKDPAVVEQLMLLGEPLKKALKVLGFSKKLNPILAFLKTKFAQELLKTKLLNINTFKAIYNAVAKRLVADSQFVVENDYNIIYCRDLYTKSPTEMLEYLKIQQSILSPTAAKYTAKALLINKKVFLMVANGPQDPAKYITFVNKLDATALPSMQDPKAKLNSVGQADKFIEVFTDSAGNAQQRAHLDSKELQKLADNLDTHAKMFVALMVLSTSSNSPEAKNALANDAFENVSQKNIAKAAIQISKFMPQKPLSDKDAKALVNIILSKV